jgi:hypothetical protein
MLPRCRSLGRTPAFAGDLRGRPNHVISFEPRPGKLPVRRRIDHALNRSRGEVWIDTQTRAQSDRQFHVQRQLGRGFDLEGRSFWFTTAAYCGRHTSIPDNAGGGKLGEPCIWRPGC